MYFQFSMTLGAVSEIQINEMLIRNTCFSSHTFKVAHDILVQPDCDRLLEILRIGILLPFHFRKIIMFSHGLVSQ